MLHRLFLFQFIILILLLSSCAPGTQNQLVKEGQSSLSSEELFVLIADSSLHLEAFDFDGTFYFQKDGYLSGRDRLNNLDTGKWDISSENQLCLKFRIWYYGDTKCYSVFRDQKPDSFIFFTENGARYYSAEYLTGDPQNLAKQIRKRNEKKFIRDQLAQEAQDGDSAGSKNISLPPEPPPSFSKNDTNLAMTRLARNCPDCNLAGVDLKKARLVEANLMGANLSKADLSGANLRRANLTGANLSGAKLITTNLSGAILVNSNLSNADFTGSNLIKANLSGANLDGATFTGAHLESIEGYK